MSSADGNAAVSALVAYTLGAAMALLQPAGSTDSTEAVKEVIDGHHPRHEWALGDSESELRGSIREFRSDELGHREIARSKRAVPVPGYRVLRRTVPASTRVVI